MLLPILSFFPTLLRALGTTDAFALAFLSGFVLRISLTVAGLGAEVELSVERVVASVSALTSTLRSSDADVFEDVFVKVTVCPFDLGGLGES